MVTIDMQQLAALFLVAVSCLLLLRGALLRHRRQANRACGHDCGCAADGPLHKTVSPETLERLRSARGTILEHSLN